MASNGGRKKRCRSKDEGKGARKSQSEEELKSDLQACSHTTKSRSCIENETAGEQKMICRNPNANDNLDDEETASYEHETAKEKSNRSSSTKDANPSESGNAGGASPYPKRCKRESQSSSSSNLTHTEKQVPFGSKTPPHSTDRQDSGYTSMPDRANSNPQAIRPTSIQLDPPTARNGDGGALAPAENIPTSVEGTPTPDEDIPLPGDNNYRHGGGSTINPSPETVADGRPSRFVHGRVKAVTPNNGGLVIPNSPPPRLNNGTIQFSRQTSRGN